MRVEIRRFREEDIPDKVRWINDPANHAFLHYDIPLTEENTALWFRRIKDAPDRLDCVIVADGMPCGLIGLLHIDPVRGDAEYYVTVGEPALKRKGVAFAASGLLLSHAFASLGLREICLYTETGNLPAQRLFRKLGFEREADPLPDHYPGGKPAFRFVLGAPAPDNRTEEPWKRP